MKNLFLVFFSVFLIPFLSAAQGNYKPGYLVTIKGDTLHGFISCKTGKKNPVEFTFKDNLNSSAEKKFSAANAGTVVISEYKIYKRFVVDISQDVVSESGPPSPQSAKPVTDAVFLNLIDSGKNVALYQYTDKIKERFFINEKNTKPVELVLHVYPDPEHLSQLVRKEIYKRQLQSLAVKYLAQFQPVVDEAQEAAYTKGDIEKIIFEINGADKTSTFTATKQYKARPFFGIGFNALSVHNFATDNYLPLSANNYANSETQQSVAVEINLGEDVFINQKEKSIILRLESHLAYSANNTITEFGSDDVLEQYNTLAVSLNPQLLFNIHSSDRTKIYLGAGGQLFIFAGSKASYTQPNYDELNPPAYYALNFTFTTRADIILDNKFDIYAGFNPAFPGQRQNSLSAFRAGINYLFGVK